MCFEVWIVKIHPYISRILQISFTQMFDSCFDNCTVILLKKLLPGKSWTLTIAQFQRPHVNYRNHFVFRKFLGRYTTSNQHIFRDFLTTNICEKGATCRDSRLHSFWNISVIIFYVIWWTGFRNWGRNAKENSPCFFLLLFYSISGCIAFWELLLRRRIFQLQIENNFPNYKQRI